MAYSIAPIVLTFPLGLGAVNCYLVDTGTGFVLIDTGSPNRRRELDAALARAGCRPGDLRLIVITHGDFDHIGNAAYLRARTGAPVAMHHGDTGMAQTGDMYANRGKRNGLVAWVTPRLVGFGPEDHFTPDIFLAEGNELAGHGFDARVLSIPGHSSGSIGILTTDGDLFCGDLFENTKAPSLTTLIDDRDSALRSAARLRSLGIKKVYPGHGKAFALNELGE